MDSGQGTLASSSSSVGKFKPRRSSTWVPCSGTKRKAHLANLGNDFDVDCRPSPAKQFAVDEEVATDILRDGFYYDPSIPSPTNENEIPDEIEMEEEFPASDHKGDYMKDPGEISSFQSSSHESMSDPSILDEKECYDDSVITPHSMHESQLVSNLVSSKTQSSVMKCFSIILSNEIQETLTQKKQNEDFILPKAIMDQVQRSSTAMALVPWKPPMKIETFLTRELQSSSKRKILKKEIGLTPQLHELVSSTVSPASTSSSTFVPALTSQPSSIKHVPYVGLYDSQHYSSEEQDKETENVRMDTSS